MVYLYKLTSSKCVVEKSQSNHVGRILVPHLKHQDKSWLATRFLLENKCSPTNSWFKQPMYHGKKSHQFITSFNNFKIYTPQKWNIDTKHGHIVKGITFFKPSFWISSRSFSGRSTSEWIFMGIFTNLTFSKLWASMLRQNEALQKCWVSERIPVLEI